MKHSARPRRHRLATALLALLAPPVAVVSAQEPTPTPAAAPPALKPLNVPLPIGQQAAGIKIPQFNLSGQILSQLMAGNIQRVDEEFLRIKELKLDLFDDGGKSEFVINLPASLFSVKTRILTSEQAVFIKHRDFDLTGSKLEFNTATRKGRLFGPVTMKIRDIERFSEKKPDAEPKPEAPTPTPTDSASPKPETPAPAPK